DDVAIGLEVDQNSSVYVTGYSATGDGGTEFLTLKYTQLPKVEKKSDGSMNVQFLTNPNSDFVLQGTTDFIGWQNLFTNTADATGFVQFNDNDAPSILYRFYRGKTP